MTKPMTVLEAAQHGTTRDLLIATRDRIAEAVSDPSCPKRELASLTMRLVTIAQAIEELDAKSVDDDISAATEVPDEPFDEAAL